MYSLSITKYAAPYAVAAVFPAALVPTLVLVASGMSGPGGLGWYVLIAPMTFLVAVGHACLLGLPVVALLYRWRLLGAWSLGLAGGLVAVLPSALMVAFRRSAFDGDDYLAFAGLGGLGAIGGLAFFLSWRFFMERRQHILAATSRGSI